MNHRAQKWGGSECCSSTKDTNWRRAEQYLWDILPGRFEIPAALYGYLLPCIKINFVHISCSRKIAIKNPFPLSRLFIHLHKIWIFIIIPAKCCRSHTSPSCTSVIVLLKKFSQPLGFIEARLITRKLDQSCAQMAIPSIQRLGLPTPKPEVWEKKNKQERPNYLSSRQLNAKRLIANQHIIEGKLLELRTEVAM